jgi:glycosyltransferase involved in cell wall biosynthesis
MRILQVIDKLDIGGAEKVFVQLANEMNSSSIVTEVLLFNDAGKLMDDISQHVVVHILDRKSKLSIAKLYRAHKLCGRFDIVHVHMRHCYAYIKLAQLIFAGEYKILFHDHFGNIELDRRVPLRLRYFFKPHYYIGVSQTLVDWAREYLRPVKTYLLTNAILGADPISFRSDDKINVLMIANIRRTKNIEFAVELCKRAGWELTIYGNRSDSEYWNYIQSVIGSEVSVRVVEGMSDFAQLLPLHNFAIHTAVSETGPLVLMEYMSAGLPFLAFDTGEVARTTKKEIGEHYIDNFDPAAWIERIEAIRINKDVPQKLIRTFGKYFSREHYIKRCQEIYENVSS